MHTTHRLACANTTRRADWPACLPTLTFIPMLATTITVIGTLASVVIPNTAAADSSPTPTVPATTPALAVNPADAAEPAPQPYTRVGPVLVGTWTTTAPFPTHTNTDTDTKTNAESVGPLRARYALVNLTDPHVDIVVTPPIPADQNLADTNPATTGLEAIDAIAQTTDAFAQEHGLVLAVNANFFGRSKANPDHLDVIGLSISDGRVVSPPRTYTPLNNPSIKAYDPAVVFIDHFRRPDPNTGRQPAGLTLGRAIIASPSDTLVGLATEAVAGVGPSGSVPDRDQWLVTDGKNTGHAARVAPEKRHPRTAVGLSKDGTTLILLVVDGRQPDWSVGVTLPELAAMMIRLGADDALNLDGGGSSAFVFTHPHSGEQLTNRPSDGRYRAVANNLGIRLRDN